MSITCTVCGTVNPEGTKYCEGCGVELTGAAANTPSGAVAPSAAPAAQTPAVPGSVEILTPPLQPASPVGSTLIDPFGMGQTDAAPTSSMPQSSAVPVISEDFASAPAASVPAPAADMAHPLEPVESTPVSAPVVEHPVPQQPAPQQPVPAELPTQQAAGQAEQEEAAPLSPTAPATSAAPVAASSGGEAKLGIKKFGAATGDFIPLQGERLVVGRFDASTGPVDIDLSGLAGQEHISRRHAELYRENGVWNVRDLGSTNGVYVRRKGESAFSPRLQEPAALSDGDELAFGNLMLSFHQS